MKKGGKVLRFEGEVDWDCPECGRKNLTAARVNGPSIHLTCPSCRREFETEIDVTALPPDH